MSDPLTIIHGDALSSLRRLPDESVQCCVTSPPYWGLRDYGLDPIVWDEMVECEHEWGSTERTAWANNVKGPASFTTGKNKTDYAQTLKYHGSWCQVCGTWRGCLGLEPTPELYVSHIVQVFHQLKRVLRNDGTLWLNLGDGYCSTAPGTNGDPINRRGIFSGVSERRANASQKVRPETPPQLKPKDLVGVPWRVAFALQADGWYLRSDIIWSKPNPMPESVTDRPTKSHEYIFLLSKSQKYYYDAEAIKEPGSWPDGPNAPDKIKSPYGQGFAREALKRDQTPRNDGARWNENNGRGFKPRSSDKQRGHSRRHAGFNDRGDAMEREQQCSGMRNKRSVWTIATRPFPEAHFATFPTDLVEPCILAGSKAGDVIIDPFAGSGTCAKVAIELGRKAIAIEPKAEYVEMIKRRCQTTIGLPITA